MDNQEPSTIRIGGANIDTRLINRIKNSSKDIHNKKNSKVYFYPPDLINRIENIK